MPSPFKGYIDAYGSGIENSLSLADLFAKHRALQNAQMTDPLNIAASNAKNQNYLDTLPQDQALGQLENQAKSMQYRDLMSNFPQDSALKRLLTQSEIAKNIMGKTEKPVWSAENGAWVMPPDANNPTGSVIQPQGMGINKKSPEYAAGLKDLAKDQANENQLTQLKGALDEWTGLNATVPTGRVSGYRPAIGQPDFQRMLQLENYFAMNNFKPGQGQISNFERSLIKGAGPSTMNDPETNASIIGMLKGSFQNIADRNAYREWYLEKNGKLLGADRAWNEYLNANPRYTKDPQTGKIIPNQNRKDWMEAFGIGADSTSEAGSPAPSDEGWGIQRIP